jgi:hypothetical protein
MKARSAGSSKRVRMNILMISVSGFYQKSRALGLTGTAFTTTNSAVTATVTRTDTFNLLLTTIYEELHHFPI